MKKTIKILITILSFILLMNIVHVKADTNYCYNLRASVGETPNEARINYHSSVSTTKVRFGKDSTLSTYTEYTPTSYLWGKGMTNNEEITVFQDRYICQVNIDGLELNTKYYYQVVYENASYKSEICSFKTATSDNTVFGVLCDTQASGSNFKYSDQLVDTLRKINSNINFFMIAGDIVDRGGYESQWINLDTYMPILNHQYLQATIPGNHELYHSSATSYIDESIYNVYYNNPKNGPVERQNSTYYFKYNEVLFIMLDTMQRSNGNNLYIEQAEWFKNVVRNNPSDFIIVVTHPGCYSAGSYTGDASIMKGKWRDLFEEYGVSLAISGHEHLYLRTKPLYQDKVDTNGITYLIGGCAGAKHYSGKNDPELFEVLLESDNPMGTYCGSIVEVVGDTLTLSYYDLYGNLRDQFSIKSKKQVVDDFNINNALDSLKVEYNEKSRRNVLSWDKSLYGYIKDINVYIEHLDVTTSKFVGPISNELPLGIGTPNRDYTYVITLIDYNDVKYTRTINVINNPVALKPSDFQINVNELSKYEYQINVTYDAKKTEQINLTLVYDGKQFTMDENNYYTLKLDSKIDLTKINLKLLFNFYGNGEMMEVENSNLSISSNLLDHEENNKSTDSSCFGGIAIAGFISMAALVLLLLKKKQ